MNIDPFSLCAGIVIGLIVEFFIVLIANWQKVKK